MVQVARFRQAQQHVCARLVYCFLLDIASTCFPTWFAYPSASGLWVLSPHNLLSTAYVVSVGLFLNVWRNTGHAASRAKGAR